MNKKLLPCPFCGGEAMIFKTYDNNFNIWHPYPSEGKCPIACGALDFVGNMEYDTVEGVVDYWNTRKPMERIVERLEEESYEYTSDPTDLGFVTKGRKLYLKDAINIVKEEGGLND